MTCIRAVQGMCTIEFTGTDFRVSTSAAHTTFAHYMGDECSRDYVYIPHARGDRTIERADRFCGRFLRRPGTNVNRGGIVSRTLLRFLSSIPFRDGKFFAL